MVLEGGLDWKAMSYAPSDMDFADTRARRRARSRWPLACRRCCWAFPATTPNANYAEANLSF